MDLKELTKLYRFQCANDKTIKYSNRSYPAKRIIINSIGKITYNPDSNKFVYFSKTDKHHSYYILNKVLRIVYTELKNAKEDKNLKDLAPDYNKFIHTSKINLEIIKNVRNFFANYIPSIKLELVTLNYLNCFGRFFQKCAVNNFTGKNQKNCPEISDSSIYGGCYGINNAWLELLNCSTYSTSKTSITIDKFFDGIIKAVQKNKINNFTFSYMQHTDKFFFEVMQNFTTTSYINPQFKSKKNINTIYKTIDNIQKNEIFNPNFLYEYDFDKIKKEFKEELSMYK